MHSLRDLLVARGYQEAITYSFVDPKVQETLFPGSGSFGVTKPNFGRYVGDAVKLVAWFVTGRAIQPKPATKSHPFIRIWSEVYPGCQVLKVVCVRWRC